MSVCYFLTKNWEKAIAKHEIHEGIILRRTNYCQSYILLAYYLLLSNQNQIKKFYLKSVHFITVQHKLSRAFQTECIIKLTCALF
jgi:hypothetical protein